MFGIPELRARVVRLEQQTRSQHILILELCRRAGISPEDVDPYACDDEERRLVAEGKKITAIKHYRERTGAGLKEAKDAVDGIAGP